MAATGWRGILGSAVSRAVARRGIVHPAPGPRHTLIVRVAQLLALLALVPAATGAGTLSAVTPLGASAGVTVRVTGTGLDPVPANNQIVLRPATGPEVRLDAVSVATLDVARDLRRVAFVMPVGLATGPAAVSVHNRTTGVTSNERPLEVIAIAVSPQVLVRGESATVRIAGSPTAQFTAGRTMVSAGTGVTVTSTTVESTTSIVVGLTVAAAAELGPRSVGVVSSLHQALLAEALTVTAPGPVNHPPVARPGGPYGPVEAGVPVGFDGRGSTDEDGDALTFAWTFGDGATGTSPTPQHAYSSAGTYDVGLTVTDPSGASDSATVQVTVLPPPDRVAPTVTLAAPASAVPGAAVRLVAAAADDTGIASVTFSVDGTIAADLQAPPYAFDLPIPGVVTIGRRYVVRATARDAAGNTASADAVITVATEPDLTPPTIGLAGPASAAAGGVVVLVAQASDDVGVASVAMFEGATEFARHEAAPFEASFLVPADTPAGTVLHFTARAVDFSGNASEAALDVPVTAVPDTVAPAVTLVAPPSATPGERLTLSVTTTDDSGIAFVEVLAAGRRLATLATPPYDVPFVVPSEAAPGSSLSLVARATDFAGQTASDTRVLTIAAPPVLATAVATGEVYDDGTGLPVAGARVVLTGTDAQGLAYAAETVTGADGSYVLRATPGQGVIAIDRAGWTCVDRAVSLGAGRVVEVFDARLTRFPAPEGSVTGALGGRLVAGAAEIDVPPGFTGDASAVRLAVVSGQALHGLLPPGWAPAGAVDLTPQDAPLPSGAVLRLAHGLDEPPPGALVVVRWDRAAQAWRVVGQGRLSGDSTRLEADVTSAGQFAWVVADTQPMAPPAAVPGELLAAAAAPVVPDALTSAVTPQPQVLFYQPGVRSTVRHAIAAEQGALPSGARLWARVRERYQFTSGAALALPPRVHDLVLYQEPGDSSTLSASQVVSPSQSFDTLTLDQGVISLELLVPPAVPSVPGLVGPEGGTIDGPDGARLVVAPGALADATPVSLRAIDLASLGVMLPDGFAWLAGMDVALGSELGAPATLSLPRPDAAPDASRVVVVRLDDLGGRTRPVLVALVRLEGDRLVTELAIGDQATSLEGVRKAGRYLLVSLPAPPGFATGTVLGVTGPALAGALVTAADYPVVGLSNGVGRFTVAGAAGPVALTAIDLVSRDVGHANVSLVAGALARVDLPLVADVPRVLATRPAAGAVNVALSDPVVVTFSEPIDPASVSGVNAGRLSMVSGGGLAVDGVVSLGSDNTVVTFRPTAPLAPDTTYTFTIAREVADTSGYTLAAAVSIAFDSLDTTPPPLPPAGAISADIPSAGRTTVTATQGTAGPRDTVWIRNRTTGTQTPVLVDANGGFRPPRWGGPPRAAPAPGARRPRPPGARW